jgi:hypothetical protein
VRVRIASLIERVVALPCEVSWELEYSGCVYCVAPLWPGGLRRKKSTPSVGWEVQVKYSRLASKELDGAQAWEKIFKFSSTVMVHS